MSENLKFYKGKEQDLKNITEIKVGAIYHCEDTGNTYLGVQYTDPDDSTILIKDFEIFSTAAGKIKQDSEGTILGEVFNDYENNKALGLYSHAEGYTTQAIGDSSHAEGCGTIAEGEASHAEGDGVIARGINAHAEGKATAAENYAHAEGFETSAEGQSSHSEGEKTRAIGSASHAEGLEAISSNLASHAEGCQTTAQSFYSHSEGSNTEAGGSFYGTSGVLEPGTYTVLSQQPLIISIFDNNWDIEEFDFIEIGINDNNYGIANVQSLTNDNIVLQLSQSVIIDEANDSLDYSLLIDDSKNAHAEGEYTLSWGQASHAEGSFCEATDQGAHAEGCMTYAYRRGSHSEGEGTLAANINAHAEGFETKVYGAQGHAEGYQTLVYGDNSHIEGKGDIIPLYLSGSQYSTIYNVATVNTAQDLSTILTSAIINKTIFIPWGQQSYITAYDSKTHTITVASTLSPQSNFNNKYGYLSYHSAEAAYSHVEGWNNVARNGNASHAEGYSTLANGNYTHSEGTETQANGSASHAEGTKSIAEGDCSHAEGYETHAIGDYSHSEGFGTWAKQPHSHAEGRVTQALGAHAHAEGYQTIAEGEASHSEGSSVQAIGYASHAEGGNQHLDGKTILEDFVLQNRTSITSSTANGIQSHAEGTQTYAGGYSSHSEGFQTEAVGSYAHAEGMNTFAAEMGSHAEGGKTRAVYAYSHAEGYNTSAYSYASHSEGSSTSANGSNAHAEGFGTDASHYQHTQGTYNTIRTNSGSLGATTNSAFIIGNGASADNRSNAFRVQYNGATYAQSSYNSTGADYAEYFEWEDLNLNNQDRRGYFVTLDGDQIKIANTNDYILGIVSGQPSIIGNADEDWRGRYILDEFGAFILENFEYTTEEQKEVIDEETGEVEIITETIKHIGQKYKENPDYDSSQSYIQRADRPEWAAVGMLGVLSVRDDGTCQVNGYCSVTDGGIATASENGYRVIQRVNDHIIKVIFR